MLVDRLTVEFGIGKSCLFIPKNGKIQQTTDTLCKIKVYIIRTNFITENQRKTMSPTQ